MALSTHCRAAYFWTIFVLVASGSLWAQRYTFWQYGAAEGLTNLSVNCLLQDRAGYIWVGTENGLFRYDGDRFQEFGHAEGLPNVEISQLAESPDGVLWVAMESGVARRNGDRFEPVQIGEKEQSPIVAFDRFGRIYVRDDSRIVRGIPDGAGSYRFSTLVHGTTDSLFVSGEDVWYIKDRGLWHLSEKKAERIGTFAFLSLHQNYPIAQDADGNLWLRSMSGLFELPKGKAQFMDRSKGIPPTTARWIYADRWGRVYVTGETGVAVLDGNTRTSLDDEHGLPWNSAGPVLLDRDGSLWIGLRGGGLVRRLGHGEWLSWKKEDGLLNNHVWSILHDRAGKLWVGTSDGLSVFDPDGRVLHSWTGRNGLAGNQVSAIVEGPKEDIYVGTSAGGISRFSKEGMLLRTFRFTSNLSEQVISMAVDREGRLWAVGSGGCFRSRAPLSTSAALTFEQMKIPGLAAQTAFRSVLAGDSGVMWASSSDGLARFDGSQWSVFTHADGLKSNDVAETALGLGALWVSYRDALGITSLKFEGDRLKTITHFTRQDGLSSNLVYALAFDHEGRLWASTDSGVSELENGRWRRYGAEDGLIWDDGDDYALHVDRGDNVWVGTSGGLSRYSAPRNPIPDSPPQAVLTTIKGGGQEFQVNDQPVLRHEQSSILIRFSSLNYSSETRARFRYRLRGFENSWNETRERDVHYAGLPAGRYVFEVIAAGPTGAWSPVPAQFSFTVKPPWWLSWWFMASCVGSALLLARALWQFRVRALMAQKALLEREVADRTAELTESHRHLEEIAYYDVLTYLPNRRMFTEQFRAQLSLARRNGESFGLLLVDLDHFKQVNDLFGHDTGDFVLAETAIRLRAAVRESDCAARLGGDERVRLRSAPGRR
jgi:ligand-binding sensor domain-containing protein